jgi:mRNA interferase RelE/StbE
LAWTLRVDGSAQKQLRKINRWQADQITKALIDIAELDDPRVRGKPMVGNYAGHWRYRVGDWRAVVRIEDNAMIIVLVAIGHRRNVYD